MGIEIPLAIICFFIGAAIEYRFPFFQRVMDLGKKWEKPPRIIHDVEIIVP